jgi:hypothetical protein
MLNFVAVESYWIKIAALAVALMLESSLGRVGLPLIPWAIIRIPFLDLVRPKSWSISGVRAVQWLQH